MRVLVLHQLPLTEDNALLLLFSALPEQVAYATAHYRRRSPETSTLLDLLLNRYRVEGVDMAMTMEEFRRYYLNYFIGELTPEERLKGLPPEERLRGLSHEALLKELTPEERLKGLSKEEIQNYLKRLNGGASPPADKPGGNGA